MARILVEATRYQDLDLGPSAAGASLQPLSVLRDGSAVASANDVPVTDLGQRRADSRCEVMM